MVKSKLEGRTLDLYLKKEIIVNNDLRYMPEDIKAEIISKTPSCAGTIRERLYWLRHDLINYPSCENCGNPVTSKQFLMNVSGNRYRRYCSKSCARTTVEFKEKAKETSLIKYGVDHSFKVPEVQVRRKQTNMLKYGREHPHPWGSDEFKEYVLLKYGTIEKYIEEHSLKVSTSLIKHYVESGKIILTIQSIENKFNVTCLNSEIIFSDMRAESNIVLADLNLEWVHNFCKKSYVSKIRTCEILVCPHCRQSGSSMLEQSILSEILLLAELNNQTVIHRDRTIIAPKEIDVLIPDLGLGIEINGLYWHNGERTERDGFITKSVEAKKQGIRLIHINEEQWLNKRDLVLAKLHYYFGLMTVKINARSCTVQDIESTVKNKFLKENHLQGADNASIKLGLFNNDELMSVMTFGKPRFSQKYTWELIRFCSRGDMIINGAFGKLFKYFLKAYVKPGDTIVSFRDLSWGLNDDNIYTKNKFILSHRSTPSYSYVSTNSPIYISRYKTQKHKLPKLLGDKFNVHLSEAENMRILGYFKFYDCGNDVYIYTC